MYWCRSVDGSYKELTLADEMCTFPLHSSLSFQQGAAIGTPYMTAYRVLVTKARLKAGETVLIHGASGAVSYFSLTAVFIYIMLLFNCKIFVCTYCQYITSVMIEMNVFLHKLFQSVVLCSTSFASVMYTLVQQMHWCILDVRLLMLSARLTAMYILR